MFIENGSSTKTSEKSVLFSSDSKTQDVENPLDFKEIISILVGGKWLIFCIAILVLLFGIVKAFLDPPIFQLNALVQIKETSNVLKAIDPISPLENTKSSIKAEIVIIKSRMVLDEAVVNLNMEIIAQPNYFPVFGKAIARRFVLRHKGSVSMPLFGYPYFAWGGEAIKVKSLEMPPSWIGKKITLIAGKDGRFKLMNRKKQLIYEGKGGTFFEIPIEGEKIPFSLFVSYLKSREGTYFTIVKQSRLIAIKSLQNMLSISEVDKGTGILNFSIESATPNFAQQILNEIADIYVRMNVEQKSEEAQKTLVFLQRQLPVVKSQLDISTDALNEYRLRKGSVDLNRETEVILDDVVSIKTKIRLLQQKKLKYTLIHPSVATIDKQINNFKKQLYSKNKKIEKLPETQQVILRLSRDVEVSTQLYTTLLNQLQTIKVTKAGTVGDVRIIDYAVLPTSPIKPKKGLIIGGALLLGLLFGIATVFIRKVLKHGVENPSEIEKHLGIPVYATIPHSQLQTELSKSKRRIDNRLDVLMLQNNEDLAIESLRSLRTTLHFLFLEAKNNIILISGPGPGIGKSFISLNLAMVLANSDKKVLLIDADMRKGLLHKRLEVKRDKGLSDLILNSIEPAEAIKTINEIGIDFISTGELPPNPSELLLHQNFEKLLIELNDQYDLIIIDSSPILAVTDASIIGRLVGATLMIVKAGEHSIAELELSVKKFKQNDVNIKGIVLNDLTINSSSYGYNYAYEKYSYEEIDTE